MPTRVLAVLFDCDGVLVDSEPLANQMLSDALASHGVVMSVDECRHAFTGLNPRGVANKLIELRGVDLTEPLVTHASALFMKALLRTGLAPLPGLTDALTHLRDRNTRLAAASNSPLDELVFKLNLSGLVGFFAPHHYSADALGQPKPDPAVYLHAADRLGVRPADCVVVEDSPLGARSGARAGMTVLGFTGTHPGPASTQALLSAGASDVFADMRELTPLLQRIGDAPA